MPENSPNLHIKKITRTSNNLWLNIHTSKGKFPIHYDDLLEYKIQKGSLLTNEEFKKIELSTLQKKIKDKVIRRLTTTHKSKKEIISIINGLIYKLSKDYNLEPSDYDKDRIKCHLFDFLEKYEYVNDQSYTTNLIEKYLSSKKPKGPLYIKNMLKSKGINQEDIDISIQNIVTENSIDIVQNAKFSVDALVKKSKYQKADDKKKKELIIRFLTAQGYPLSTIIEILKDLQ